jgi:hypothetical protein
VPYTVPSPWFITVHDTDRVWPSTQVAGAVSAVGTSSGVLTVMGSTRRLFALSASGNTRPLSVLTMR